MTKPKQTEEKTVTVTLSNEGKILVSSDTMTIYEVLGVLHGAINLINTPGVQEAPKKKGAKK